MENIDVVAAEYIRIRDEKKRLDKAHADKMKPYTDRMQEIADELLGYMNQNGITSIKTVGGTPMKSVVTSFPVENWEAFYGFVQDNDLGHMIEKRASKSAVQEFLEADGILPPGIGMNSFARVTVRKA